MAKHPVKRATAHASRRKAHHNRRHTQRRRGGVAPVTYSLAGSWPSRMSLGQGVDYETYHQGQHGGVAPYPASVQDAMALPADMRAPAMVDGTLQAIADVRGLRDPPFDQMPSASTSTAQMGGRGRKHRSRKHKKSHRRAHRHRSHRKTRGGALGYAPVNAPAMLLSSKAQYDAAGLNPDYRGAAVEYLDAKARDINQGKPWA